MSASAAAPASTAGTALGTPSGAAGGLGAGSASGSNGAGPGAASSTAAADARAKLLSSYLAHVRARVDRHHEYPYLARRANIEGTVRLRISIAASGQLLGVTPTAGASLAPLVEAALKSVSSAAPFPPLPTALGTRVTLDLPVDFRLDAL
ncbi:MAG TPA: energy transducer TonB [Polyangiaceae bacterium]|nr:energy transducer TonB [Polyangiaceae bacterium]